MDLLRQNILEAIRRANPDKDGDLVRHLTDISPTSAREIAEVMALIKSAAHLK